MLTLMSPTAQLSHAFAVVRGGLVVCRATLSAVETKPAAEPASERPNLDRPAAVINRVWLAFGFHKHDEANQRVHSDDEPADVILPTLFRQQCKERLLGAPPVLPRHGLTPGQRLLKKCNRRAGCR